MISLSDLKAKRAAMTQGRLFTVNPPFGDGTMIRAGAEDADGQDIADCAMVHYCDDEEHVDPAVFQANATGIVATHNAADVLIEIAEAALAYEQAKIDAAVIRYTYATADDRRTVGAQRIEAHDRDEIRCREAYRAAIAKIKP